MITIAITGGIGAGVRLAQIQGRRPGKQGLAVSAPGHSIGMARPVSGQKGLCGNLLFFRAAGEQHDINHGSKSSS